ncbi:GAF domain-containing protein [Paenibacillus aurantiacus]|uniref:GAF domain-containing protein n=1 Tax=Paenibacillus aurantiacus TaxID=1936118 RepID=A0ABV5KQ36_9BACL
MGDFFKELLDKMPGWFFACAAIIFLIGLGGIILWFVLGARRFSAEMGKDTKLQVLQESLSAEKENNRQNIERVSQLNGALAAINPLLDSLNKLRVMDPSQEKMYSAVNLIKRAIDTLANDVKSKAGERHRCGLWIESDRNLRLQAASSGFPNNYAQYRVLHVDRSLAGKSFRLGQILNIPDVTTQDEWQKNEQSTSKYKSLICVPINNWGVLTIDGLNPMSDECQLIGEVYATILEGAFNEYMSLLPSLHDDEEDVS